jgi:ApaG protein
MGGADRKVTQTSNHTVAPMYDKITRSIRVSVEPSFLDDQSSPEDDYFVWAYAVSIENEGEEVVQLKNRYWRITDATGRIEEVRGAGVVGEQPVLQPGDRFEYTSGAPLATPTGFMVGTYQMQTSNGEVFDVEIPAFSLDSPHMSVQIH